MVAPIDTSQPKQVDVIPDCPICIEPLVRSPTAAKVRTLVCGHLFHEACIDRWNVMNTCPLCRHVIDITKVINLKNYVSSQLTEWDFLKFYGSAGVAAISAMKVNIMLQQEEEINDLAFYSLLAISVVVGGKSLCYLSRITRFLNVSPITR